MAAVFSNQLMWKERLQPPPPTSPPSVNASETDCLCFFLCVLQKMKMEMTMMMTTRRTKTRRRRRRRSMWSRWRRGRRWSGATPARQRPGIPARSCWRGATSPPTSIITPPIHPWGTSSRPSRNWSWRAAAAVAEEEEAAAAADTATAGSSNRSAATASVQALGRLTRRTMTREGLTMFWSARGGTSSSWASSPCGTRSPRWPTTRRRPKWWSWRKPQSASTTCSQTNRHSSLSKNSWGGKVNF